MLKGTFSVEIRDDDVSQEIATKLKRLLLFNGMEESKIAPDYVFIVGGDGTVLRTFNKYVDIVNDVKFLSIHTGHLGFYTDYSVQNFEKIFHDMVSIEPVIDQYPLLRINAYCKDNNLIADYYSLNEVTVDSMTGSTYAARVYINGEHFENFRGDGLCISTPTGSTAYNKSLGGAVIHPQMDLFQVTEIAALNNLVYRTLGNPIILSKDDELVIIPNEYDDHRIRVDYMDFNYNTVSKIKITLAEDKKISFIRYNDVDFWKRVKRSFIGDE
ncbi:MULTISPECIES: NAD kinase [Gemella]|uniref:NAD kinase n=1 Tax=Gemella TaxID=1378 RepID=UPI0007681239|nr:MULTISPECIES: NAD kinase [Gemella]AME10099.1 NAD(+) kinase [Gemella sp. oral taxon 928]AXI26235.1 NAD kinase [Gemella sp. ND 6198]